MSREALERTWENPPGFLGWFTHVSHQSIGRRYIVTAFIFFLLAGITALVMRTQLAAPESDLVAAETYRQLFTMHGSTMMFLFAVPIMEGIGIYLVPMMIGTRDMAFPRLNAFGYYVYLIAGVVLYISFFLGVAPDSGWFNYVPLAGPEFSPGLNVDFWATMITFLELAALVAAVELIVTIFKLRAPGMSLDRVPIFVWAILVMAFMIVFAMPPLVVGSLMLALDRTVGTVFFDPALMGEPLLWQHLFWFFGHPEVYIILVPGLGIVSSIVVSFARRPMFGYTAVVLSLVAIGFVSFGLWVHHMFTTGLPELGMSFFTAASMMIAIPSGVQIFCWIATLWSGRPRLRTPLLFVLGFIFIFVLGGITGVMVASVPFDAQVHDTHFIVAHLHYVLVGGAVFPLFGGVYYWFPKLTGRLLDERLGSWHFWLAFIGFNVAFFPLHQLGFLGMPRRVHTYAEGLGWGGLNLLSTVGAFVLAAGIAVFVWNVVASWRKGRTAGSDPWEADTLEWATSSPPATYNFAEIPRVRGRNARWHGDLEGLSGVRDDRREVLVTRLLDAVPDSRTVLATPSHAPLLAAMAVSVAFIGLIHSTAWVPVGFALTFLALVAWNWPPGRRPRPATPDEEVRREVRP